MGCVCVCGVVWCGVMCVVCVCVRVCECVLFNQFKKSIKKNSHYSSRVELLGGRGGVQCEKMQ